jgi:NADH-quinone oxidoreductase subunit N
VTIHFGILDWNALLPVAIVAIAALVVLASDLLSPSDPPRYLPIGLGLAGTIAAAVVAAGQYAQHKYIAFFGGFVTGGFTIVFEEIVLLALAGSLVLFGSIGPARRIAAVTALMMWSACGAMVMAGAANLMTIFLGLELLSLALYCLCGLADRPRGREAALKYLILSSTASGFMLYGMALLFGASGSVALVDFVSPAVIGNPLFWMGSCLFLIGIAFKLSLVPFHTWAPDVYEGAPLPVTAFMSVATKAGALAVLGRFIYAAYQALPPPVAERLLLPIWIVAGISMIAGNVGMLAQRDLKRLLAYSGIAQAGYILTAFAGGSAAAGGSDSGFRYAIFYFVAYAFMNLGAFAVAATLSGEEEEGSRLLVYRGLARRRPVAAAAMSLFLIALAGLPPTAGFLGKILILWTSVNAGFVWLAALLVAGTAVSLYAYAKVIGAMYGRDEAHRAGEQRPNVPLAWISVAICAVVVIAMTFYPLTPSNVLPVVK